MGLRRRIYAKNTKTRLTSGRRTGGPRRPPRHRPPVSRFGARRVRPPRSSADRGPDTRVSSRPVLTIGGPEPHPLPTPLRLLGGSHTVRRLGRPSFGVLFSVASSCTPGLSSRPRTVGGHWAGVRTEGRFSFVSVKLPSKAFVSRVTNQGGPETRHLWVFRLSGKTRMGLGLRWK